MIRQETTEAMSIVRILSASFTTTRLRCPRSPNTSRELIDNLASYLKLTQTDL